MALENNATCNICGKKYHMCRTCQGIKSFQPWRTVTDTLPHYMIYLVLSEYTKTKDKVSAREELLKCDLSELDSFNENIRNTINDILSYNCEKTDIDTEEKNEVKSNENQELDEMEIEPVQEKNNAIKKKKNVKQTNECNNE